MAALERLRKIFSLLTIILCVVLALTVIVYVAILVPWPRASINPTP
jgi:hypothetical protein